MGENMRQKRRKQTISIDIEGCLKYASKKSPNNVEYKEPKWLMNAKKVIDKMSDKEYDEWLEKAIKTYNEKGIDGLFKIQFF